MTIINRCTPAATARRGGFTLIEVLVVVAVVGVLAAILLPVFSSAREASRTSACSSNLRQMHLGVQMYLSDNNGRYMAPLTASAYGTHCQWPVFIEKYVRSPKVFECPANSTGLYRSGCPAPEPLDDEGHMQEWTGGYRMADLRGPGRLIHFSWIGAGRIRNPSGIALIVDAGHESTGSTIGFCRSEGCLSEPPVEESFARSGLATKPVHGDRKNVLFADGHVKALTQQQLFQPSMWAF